MVKTLKAVRFLFVGPMILLLLFVISRMTAGQYWFRWAALGIGIAWVISLFRVLSAIVVVGGLAALGAWFMRGRNKAGSGPPPPPRY